MNKPASELIALADELREFTALRFSGDCKCGKCQLVPRETIIKAMNALRNAVNQDALRKTLEIARRMIRGEMIENAVIDIDTMQSLGAMIDAALATPPAQPAPASGDEVERLRDALSLALQYLPAQPTDSDAQKDIARIHDLIAGKTVAWNEMHVSESPSTHGKPDGAVREAALRLLAAEDERQSQLHDLLETIREQIRLEVPVEHRPAGLFKNIQDAVYATRGRTPLMNDAAVTAALHPPKITTAKTSPGDVLAMKEACKRIVAEVVGARDDLGNVHYTEIAAAIDRLDVKAEAKSQEPEAVTETADFCRRMFLDERDYWLGRLNDSDATEHLDRINGALAMLEGQY